MIPHSGEFFKLTGITKAFGGLTAVNDVSLFVEQGSITAIIGPNGAGKTTLFNVISGFYPPDRGTIEWLGRRIDGLPPHAIARRGLMRTFQVTRVLTKMTVLENVMAASTRNPGERLFAIVATPWRIRSAESRTRDEAWEMLELVGLSHLATEYAGTLSGGQRKLLEFAMAVMAAPHMLLLDEPLAGVNPVLGGRLVSRIASERESHGTTILVVEHDMNVVMSMSDRVVVMHEGRILADGTPQVVQRDQRVIDAYLGTSE